MDTTGQSPPVFLTWGLAITIVLALVIVGWLYWRRGSPAEADDLYATVPFRPSVTYESSSIAVTNTEREPYFDTSLRVYVGSTLYTARIGPISPGETRTCPLRSLTNERGESFEPGLPRTSELEVRARFDGYDVHKDFPPPYN